LSNSPLFNLSICHFFLSLRSILFS